MFERFGRTLLFIIALLAVLQGTKVALTLVRPKVASISPTAGQGIDFLTA